ncbi:hypothetical protein [Canibacter zhoujuaniae]|uniref:hypothetical protein n=1 Tax=Canibacter zhoujuaniae TaxID=2708343 RepID=UPI0014218E52|nr:hypothetical protein [Canibacter zhoujuaniae]
MRRRKGPKSSVEEWSDFKGKSDLLRYAVYCVQVIAIIFGALGTLLVDVAAVFTSRSVLGLILITISAITAVGFQVWVDGRTRELEKRRNKHITNFNDHLDGIITPLLNLASSDGGMKTAEIFTDAVLAAGVHLFPEDGLRLCLYRLEDISDVPPGENLEGSDHYLQLIGSRGRLDVPRRYFIPGEKASNHAIEIALGHSSRPFSLVPEDDDRFSRYEGSVWCSYMEFPLIGKHRNLGALMVDSRERVLWTQEHQAIGQTVATLLSHGLDLLPSAARDVVPELTSLQGVEGILPSGWVS